MTYSWLTIHRVTFDEERDANVSGAPNGPELASVWRFGPNAPLGENGLRTGVAQEWGGVGFYHSRKDAEAVVAAPDEHLDFLGDTTEGWHALAGVIAHRGEVDWSKETEPHPTLTPLKSDPGGVMAVITSAGYLSRDASQLDRIRDFLKKVEEVVEFYGTLEANVVRTLFNTVGTKEGMTFSVWNSDKGMIASAYKPGLHSEYMAQHNQSPMFDRSSFTRLRLFASNGSWDGIDPREAATG